MSEIIGIKIVPRNKQDWVNNINQDWPIWEIWLTEFDNNSREFVAFSLSSEQLDWRDETLRMNLISDAIGATGDRYRIYHYGKFLKKRIFVPSYLCNECGNSYFPIPPDKGIIREDCSCGSNQWTRFWIDEYAIKKLFKIV